MADLNDVLQDALVHISRLALAGRRQDVHAQLRQVITRLRRRSPDVAKQLAALLASAPSLSAPLREAGAGMVPIDADSRLALVRHEFPVQLDESPILAGDLAARLDQIVAEQRAREQLEAKGLPPTRSLLFVGPPGVGKTMTARWIAMQLDLPLITLDLATVMSSYLGKTGSNIRSALEYAKSVDSVLLLDEFDAIAKRRDDEGDVGELKRLVTVLLQEIDDWPSTSLLIAATNHGELLDPAVWRRFDELIEFGLPDDAVRQQFIASLFSEDDDPGSWLGPLTELWADRSPSDIARLIRAVRRRVAIQGMAMNDALAEAISPDLRTATPRQRKAAARVLERAGFSDRRVSTIVGISRDTMRKSRSEAEAGA